MPTLLRETVVSSCSKALQLLSKMRQNLRGLPIYLFFWQSVEFKTKRAVAAVPEHGFEGMTCIYVRMEGIALNTHTESFACALIGFCFI